MGDGNIEWNPEKQKLTLEELHSLAKHEDFYDTPRSTNSMDGTECLTPRSPTAVVLEELHRNTNHSVNTPDLSNASFGNATVERPPAGETQISPRRNGRRNFRQDATSADNAFGLPLGPAAGLGRQETGQSEADGIFSVRGTRSVKINRHRDNVTVFPSGCMGVTDIEEEGQVTVPAKSEEVVKEIEPEVATPAPELAATPKSESTTKLVAPPSHHSHHSEKAMVQTPSRHSEMAKSVVQASGEKAPGAKSPGAKSPGAKSPGAKPPGVKSPRHQSPAVPSPRHQPPAVPSPRHQSPARGSYRASQPPNPDVVKPVAYTSSRGSFRPNSAARNPLTGEGYADKDIRRHFIVKKPDGNPLLGQGYDDAKSGRPKHVPPGGYSKGLW